MKLYRVGKMGLDQLMAFAVSDDHAAQEAAWFKQPEWNRDPATVRRVLTSAHVEATDRQRAFRRRRYLSDGRGNILRDLFAEAHEGYLTDPAVLDRLAVERLEREAETIRAEGWKWVEIMPRPRLRGTQAIPPGASRTAATRSRAAGRARPSLRCYDALTEEHGEDPPEPMMAEMEALANQIDTLSQRARCWRSEDIGRAGAVIGIGHAGNSQRRARPCARRRCGRSRGDTVRADRRSGERQEASGELSAALVENLTAQRTAALRAVLASNPDTALTAVVHAMALPLFYDRFGAKSCLSLRLETADLRGERRGHRGRFRHVRSTERHAQWTRHLPESRQ